MNQTTPLPVSDSNLRRIFKLFNKLMVLMWRLGLGVFMRSRWLSGQIMVIAHVGRKSRLWRYTPVNYAIYEGDVYCTAGFGQISDWYKNIRHDANVELWMPGGWWQAEAEDITHRTDATQRLREVLIASGFAAYLFGVNPDRLSQADLSDLLRTYRVVRFKRTVPRTGKGGPGEFAWIWPVAALIILIAGLWRSKNTDEK